MLRKLLPVLLSLAAFIGGAAGGEMLRRPAAPAEAAADAHAGVPEEGHGEDAAPAHDAPSKDAGGHAEPASSGHDGAPAGHGAHAPPAGGHGGGTSGYGASDEVPATAWFEFPQQFLVPILYDGQLDSTMILTLSVEMPGTARETVYAHDIKLRDALLRQLLIHANTGGFDGNFTSEAQLRKLRAGLTAAVQGVVPEITDVLIGDIGRQER